MNISLLKEAVSHFLCLVQYGSSSTPYGIHINVHYHYQERGRQAEFIFGSCNYFSLFIFERGIPVFTIKLNRRGIFMISITSCTVLLIASLVTPNEKEEKLFLLFHFFFAFDEKATIIQRREEQPNKRWRYIHVRFSPAAITTSPFPSLIILNIYIYWSFYESYFKVPPNKNISVMKENFHRLFYFYLTFLPYFKNASILLYFGTLFVAGLFLCLSDLCVVCYDFLVKRLSVVDSLSRTNPAEAVVKHELPTVPACRHANVDPASSSRPVLECVPSQPRELQRHSAAVMPLTPPPPAPAPIRRPQNSSLSWLAMTPLSPMHQLVGVCVQASWNEGGASFSRPLQPLSAAQSRRMVYRATRTASRHTVPSPSQRMSSMQITCHVTVQYRLLFLLQLQLLVEPPTIFAFPRDFCHSCLYFHSTNRMAPRPRSALASERWTPIAYFFYSLFLLWLLCTSSTSRTLPWPWLGGGGGINLLASFSFISPLLLFLKPALDLVHKNSYSLRFCTSSPPHPFFAGLCCLPPLRFVCFVFEALSQYILNRLILCFLFPISDKPLVLEKEQFLLAYRKKALVEVTLFFIIILIIIIDFYFSSFPIPYLLLSRTLSSFKKRKTFFLLFSFVHIIRVKSGCHPRRTAVGNSLKVKASKIKRKKKKRRRRREVQERAKSVFFWLLLLAPPQKYATGEKKRIITCVLFFLFHFFVIRTDEGGVLLSSTSTCRSSSHIHAYLFIYLFIAYRMEVDLHSVMISRPATAGGLPRSVLEPHVYAPATRPEARALGYPPALGPTSGTAVAAGVSTVVLSLSGIPRAARLGRLDSSIATGLRSFTATTTEGGSTTASLSVRVHGAISNRYTEEESSVTGSPFLRPASQSQQRPNDGSSSSDEAFSRRRWHSAEPGGSSDSKGDPAAAFSLPSSHQPPGIILRHGHSAEEADESLQGTAVTVSAGFFSQAPHEEGRCSETSFHSTPCRSRSMPPLVEVAAITSSSGTRSTAIGPGATLLEEEEEEEEEKDGAGAAGSLPSLHRELVPVGAAAGSIAMGWHGAGPSEASTAGANSMSAISLSSILPSVSAPRPPLPVPNGCRTAYHGHDPAYQPLHRRVGSLQPQRLGMGGEEKGNLGGLCDGNQQLLPADAECFPLPDSTTGSSASATSPACSPSFPHSSIANALKRALQSTANHLSNPLPSESSEVMGTTPHVRVDRPLSSTAGPQEQVSASATQNPSLPTFGSATLSDESSLGWFRRGGHDTPRQPCLDLVVQDAPSKILVPPTVSFPLSCAAAKHKTNDATVEHEGRKGVVSMGLQQTQHEDRRSGLPYLHRTGAVQPPPPPQLIAPGIGVDGNSTLPLDHSDLNRPSRPSEDEREEREIERGGGHNFQCVTPAAWASNGSIAFHVLYIYIYYISSGIPFFFCLIVFPFWKQIDSNISFYIQNTLLRRGRSTAVDDTVNYHIFPPPTPSWSFFMFGGFGITVELHKKQWSCRENETAEKIKIALFPSVRVSKQFARVAIRLSIEYGGGPESPVVAGHRLHYEQQDVHKDGLTVGSTLYVFLATLLFVSLFVMVFFVIIIFSLIDLCRMSISLSAMYIYQVVATHSLAEPPPKKKSLFFLGGGVYCGTLVWAYPVVGWFPEFWSRHFETLFCNYLYRFDTDGGGAFPYGLCKDFIYIFLPTPILQFFMEAAVCSFFVFCVIILKFSISPSKDYCFIYEVHILPPSFESITSKKKWKRRKAIHYNQVWPTTMRHASRHLQAYGVSKVKREETRKRKQRNGVKNLFQIYIYIYNKQQKKRRDESEGERSAPGIVATREGSYSDTRSTVHGTYYDIWPWSGGVLEFLTDRALIIRIYLLPSFFFSFLFFFSFKGSSCCVVYSLSLSARTAYQESFNLPDCSVSGGKDVARYSAVPTYPSLLGFLKYYPKSLFLVYLCLFAQLPLPKWYYGGMSLIPGTELSELKTDLLRLCQFAKSLDFTESESP
eukprot:gene6355-4581_t